MLLCLYHILGYTNSHIHMLHLNQQVYNQKKKKKTIQIIIKSHLRKGFVGRTSGEDLFKLTYPLCRKHRRHRRRLHGHQTIHRHGHHHEQCVTWLQWISRLELQRPLLSSKRRFPITFLKILTKKKFWVQVHMIFGE